MIYAFPPLILGIFTFSPKELFLPLKLVKKMSQKSNHAPF